MSGFEDKEIIKLLDRLIGDIEPYGESNTDEKTYKNLCQRMRILDVLLMSIIDISGVTHNGEFSIKRSKDKALDYLLRLKEDLDELLKER